MKREIFEPLRINPCPCRGGPGQIRFNIHIDLSSTSSECVLLVMRAWGCVALGLRLRRYPSGLTAVSVLQLRLPSRRPPFVQAQSFKRPTRLWLPPTTAFDKAHCPLWVGQRTLIWLWSRRPFAPMSFRALRRLPPSHPPQCLAICKYLFASQLGVPSNALRRLTHFR